MQVSTIRLGKGHPETHFIYDEVKNGRQHGIGRQIRPVYLLPKEPDGFCLVKGHQPTSGIVGVILRLVDGRQKSCDRRMTKRFAFSDEAEDEGSERVGYLEDFVQRVQGRSNDFGDCDTETRVSTNDPTGGY